MGNHPGNDAIKITMWYLIQQSYKIKMEQDRPTKMKYQRFVLRIQLDSGLFYAIRF